MLVAHHQLPRMGSSQPPPDDYLPFGYSIEQSQEPLFEPPEPAPGAPLLSETDTKLISSFFDDITADQYNVPSFGEGLNFSDDWYNDLPPQFMGSTTSFGAYDRSPLPTRTPHNSLAPGVDGFDGARLLPVTSELMPPPPPPAASSSTSSHSQNRHSDDVLHAAATLVQNGSAGRTGSLDSSASKRPMGPPVGHLRHQGLDEFRKEGRKGVDSQAEIGNTFKEWMWGPQERVTPTPPPAPHVDYQFGSDSNFSAAQGYTSESSKDTVATQQEEQLKVLECLEAAQSAGNTAPSSPINGYGALPDDGDAPPRKRRKSKGARDNGDNVVDGQQGTNASRRKKNGATSSPKNDTPLKGKRRKAPVVKPPRENLSEEQKRENHIKSEQKRRTLIKEGFDDLCELVPGLQGGGFSKSIMLTMAAEWLEDILQGNAMLSNQLAGLQRR